METDTAINHIDQSHPEMKQQLIVIVNEYIPERQFIMIHKLFLDHNSMCDTKLNVIDFDKE